MNTTLFTTIGAVAGIVVGGLTVYWNSTDRIEKQVTDRVRIESKVVRLDERVKALESQLWTLQNKPLPTN